MGECAGIYTKGIKDKDEAIRLMREDAEREYDISPSQWKDYYSFSPEDITDKTVKETRYYQHRNKFCEGETIGDDGVCYHCGEVLENNGRKTFAFFAEL